jgi:hypothetical protein
MYVQKCTHALCSKRTPIFNNNIKFFIYLRVELNSQWRKTESAIIITLKIIRRIDQFFIHLFTCLLNSPKTTYKMSMNKDETNMHMHTYTIAVYKKGTLSHLDNNKN